MTQRARNRFVLARIETFDLKTNNSVFLLQRIIRFAVRDISICGRFALYPRKLHWDIKCVFFTVFFSAVGRARNVGQAERRDDGCQDEAHCVRVQIGECTLQFKRIPAHLRSHMSAEILLY